VGGRVLLVEDEQGLVMTLRDRLVSEGYEVESAADGAAGYTLAMERAYDLIVLDLMLPRKDGLTVCRDLRARGVAVPVLMLTARGELTDRVTGLKMGADDYLVKPFQMPELLARVEALLRRPPGLRDAAGDSVVFGPFRLDLRRSALYRGEEEVALTAQEYRLLAHLVSRRGETLSRDQLLDAVWGYDSIPTTRTVDVHVAWLRGKIEENPSHPKRIITIRNRGYRFTAEA
jgi:two-component system, OmpR family, alkaline phosphatase synthesis response regulator PhoP